MSLTQDDLQQIRLIVQEVFRPLEGEVRALREDVKEIYVMLSDIDGRVANLEKRAVVFGESFEKLSVKEQILRMNAMIVDLAKKEGVVLPR